MNRVPTWTTTVLMILVAALIGCGLLPISERLIAEIASCTEPSECGVATNDLFRLLDAFGESDPRVSRSVVSNAVRTIAFRRDEAGGDERRQIRDRLEAAGELVVDEDIRRDDVLDQLIAEADEQYRVGVASPADALVGFWLDVSQRVNRTLNSGYHLMPNGYFVHTLFGGTPTNYAGSWGRWEVTGDELVLHYRTLIFIEESVSRLEPVDDVVRIPTSNLRDRDGDDPPAFSGRFPFPHAIGQGRMMQELPLVEYLRTSNLGLWEGAPSIVPSEYEDLRQLRRTVWQTNFDAERGAFIELPFER